MRICRRRRNDSRMRLLRKQKNDARIRVFRKLRFFPRRSIHCPDRTAEIQETFELSRNLSALYKR